MALKKIKCKLIDILNSILNNLSTHRYIDSFLNLQKEINEMVIELIVDFISLIDKAYKKSDERKKEFYINKSNVPRTIFTIYGEITFEKTLYRSKKDNKRYYCFVDDVLGIENYYLYDSIIRGISISDAVNYNTNNASYHSSLDSLNILDSLNRNGIPYYIKAIYLSLD